LQTKRSVETSVLRGFAADALIDLIESEKIGLVVMATHGRAGIMRTTLGSVADRMIQGPAPVLLVRPPHGGE
jgi:nucleotide-binding universal stress UspA family protein